MHKVVVIGGAVIDLFAYPHQKIQMNDSNPGYFKTSFGGVGRNIAENLVRLGVDTTLLTVLGKDAQGLSIQEHSKNIGLKLSIIDADSTPSYISIMDEMHDTVVAIAAMDQISLLTKEEIEKRKELLDQADLIVVDTNLSLDALDYVFHRFTKPIYVDAISGPKAKKLRPFIPFITGLKMNMIEASLISEQEFDSSNDLNSMGKYFINQGVKEVYITMGSQGSFYMCKDSSTVKKAIKVPILNTTGAGDAFFAGAIYARMHDQEPLNYAMASAIINLQDEKAVSSQLTVELLEKTIKENQL